MPRDDQRKIIITEAHDDPQSGHLGIQKTYIRIARDYFWPNCFREVRECLTCQTCKVEQAAPPGTMNQRTIEEPWTMIAADIVGPLPKSRAQFQYLLVIQDLFTKWVELKPLRSANGKRISEAFRELVLNR